MKRTKTRATRVAPSANSAQVLRRRAEEIALEKAAQTPEKSEAWSANEAIRSLHELQVHQIELTMQNEELRRARADLEASQARYFDLYDLAPVGYCSLNEKGLIEEANLTAATLLGVARRDLVKQPITRWILSEDQDIYHQSSRRIFGAGTPFECEVRMLRAGVPFWGGLHASLGKDTGGSPVCQLVMTDVSDRREAEKKALSAQALLGSVVASSTDAIYVKDLQGRYLLFNPGATRVTGKKEEDVLGKDDRFLFPPEEAKIVMDRDRKVMGAGRVMTYEEVVTTASGRVETYLSTKGPIFDSQGRVSGLFGIARDITDRKQAEEALRESEAKFRYTWDYSPIGKSLTQPSGEVHVNMALCRMLGYSREELQGRTWQSISHPDDLQTTQQAVDSLISGKHDSERFIKRYIRKDVSVRPSASGMMGWDGDNAAVRSIGGLYGGKERSHEGSKQARAVLEQAPTSVAAIGSVSS